MQQCGGLSCKPPFELRPVQAERQGAVRRAGEGRPSPDRPSATSRRPASQQPTVRRLLSAEEKIQQELLQMKEREDELRYSSLPPRKNSHRRKHKAPKGCPSPMVLLFRQ